MTAEQGQESERLRAENAELREQLAVAPERIAALQTQLKQRHDPPAFVKPQRQKAFILLVGAGCAALAFYFAWWFELWQFRNPLSVLALAAAIIYSGPQLLGDWILYLSAKPFRTLPEPDQPFTVDIYVTTFCEDLELVCKTLLAARDVRGKHQTWLLDDGPNAQHMRLAHETGVGYITRADRRDAKAGNINAALPKTDGEIIAIFDVDHVPAPDFLEYTLPYFRDPHVGFVQVMLTFSNSEQSWIARAATESSFDYYNPTCWGASQLKGVTLTGSNALIRRTALESIGGYQPGLAEDLATSMSLHGAGWQSVYVPEPLAPGLAPMDQVSWCVQQFKWSRGVFELFLTRLWSSLASLTNGQRVCYLVRTTYYWIGLVVFAHLFATLLALFSGSPAAYRMFSDYLLHLLPLACLMMVIRQAALSNYRHEQVPRTLLWRPTVLVFATWPVYTVAWFMALLRIPLRFQPTPKAVAGRPSGWLVPQILSIALLLTGSFRALATGSTAAMPVVAFALLMSLLQIPFLMQFKYDGVRTNPAKRVRPVEFREADHAD